MSRYKVLAVVVLDGEQSKSLKRFMNPLMDIGEVRVMAGGEASQRMAGM
jgi:hypothetical protein